MLRECEILGVVGGIESELMSKLQCTGVEAFIMAYQLHACLLRLSEKSARLIRSQLRSPNSLIKGVRNFEQIPRRSEYVRILTELFR